MKVYEALFAISLVMTFCTSAFADCCEHCGCDCECRKVCHLKCDVKKVTKYEYSCECEDFCVPGKSKKVGTKCDCECKSCLLGHCKEHCHEKPVYKPTCAKVHTKTKLIKHEVVKEEPTYKWVVETICDGCAASCHTVAEGQTQADVEANVMAEEMPPVPSPVEDYEANVNESAATEGQTRTSWINARFAKGLK